MIVLVVLAQRYGIYTYSHALLVYLTKLWCWYSSIVSIRTRSCSVALKACSCALTLGVRWYYSSMNVYILVQSLYVMVEPSGGVRTLCG